MTVDIQHTFSHITDQIVDVFSFIQHGELYYNRVLSSIWNKTPILIEREHVKHLESIIKPLTNEQFNYCVNNAVYKFLNDNTACGFADWARNTGRLTWQLG